MKYSIRGITASKGSACGKIVFVKETSDIRKMKNDSIIVTDKISVEFTEIFSKAVAIIAECGGIMCHAAIVCRELQKPCVVQCADAFVIFQEGKQISLSADELTYFKLNSNE